MIKNDKSTKKVIITIITYIRFATAYPPHNQPPKTKLLREVGVVFRVQSLSNE